MVTTSSCGGTKGLKGLPYNCDKAGLEGVLANGRLQLLWMKTTCSFNAGRGKVTALPRGRRCDQLRLTIDVLPHTDNLFFYFKSLPR